MPETTNDRFSTDTGTCFVKMRDIQDRFNKALSYGSNGKVNSLNKYTCLATDEVGYCNPWKKKHRRSSDSWVDFL